MVNPLEQIFPGLAKGDYRVTSPKSRDYNCIAWAAGDTANWWWPGSDPMREYWPAGVERAQTLAAFQKMFASQGYLLCDNGDLETGFEKIAIFADNHQVPLHAARQLPSGRWTSKLGRWVDIEHGLRDLDGASYGSVAVFMKRQP